MKWTESELVILKENYINGTELLIKILNRSRLSITHKANRLGLSVSHESISSSAKINAHKARVRKENYRVNDISINIDEYSSYILGLVWSDGYILKNRNTVALTMVKDDLNEIDWIFKKTGNWYIQDRKRKNRRESRTLIAYNPNFYDKLLSLDYDKKSYLSPHKVCDIIPSKLIKYFIRGVIDGDGCFYINRNQYTYQITIASTYEQDWSFYINLFNKIGCQFSIQRRIQGKNKSSIIRLCKKIEIKNFIDWLYDGYEEDKIGLSRKYNKSLLLLK